MENAGLPPRPVMNGHRYFSGGTGIPSYYPERRLKGSTDYPPGLRAEAAAHFGTLAALFPQGFPYIKNGRRQNMASSSQTAVQASRITAEDLKRRQSA